MKFSTEKKGPCVVVSCRGDLDASNAAEFDTLLAQACQDAAGFTNGAVLIDFDDRFELDQAGLRAIAKHAKGAKLLACNVPRPVVVFINEMGMNSAIRVRGTLDQALAEIPGASKAPQKLDVNFINPFVESTLETLKVQANTEATAGKPFLKGSQPGISQDIAGVIGLTSRAFNGSIALVFPEKTFLAIMNGMLGEQNTAINRELEDGAGELLNIIFGGAKRVLNDRGYAIEKAIPTIVRGKDIEVRHLTPVPVVVMPFQTAAGPFHIEIGTDS